VWSSVSTLTRYACFIISTFDATFICTRQLYPHSDFPTSTTRFRFLLSSFRFSYDFQPYIGLHDSCYRGYFEWASRARHEIDPNMWMILTCQIHRPCSWLPWYRRRATSFHCDQCDWNHEEFIRQGGQYPRSEYAPGRGKGSTNWGGSHLGGGCANGERTAGGYASEYTPTIKNVPHLSYFFLTLGIQRVEILYSLLLVVQNQILRKIESEER
jgi:hypothetical protein